MQMSINVVALRAHLRPLACSQDGGGQIEFCELHSLIKKLSDAKKKTRKLSEAARKGRQGGSIGSRKSDEAGLSSKADQMADEIWTEESERARTALEACVLANTRLDDLQNTPSQMRSELLNLTDRWHDYLATESTLGSQLVTDGATGPSWKDTVAWARWMLQTRLSDEGDPSRNVEMGKEHVEEMLELAREWAWRTLYPCMSSLPPGEWRLYWTRVAHTFSSFFRSSSRRSWADIAVTDVRTAVLREGHSREVEEVASSQAVRAVASILQLEQQNAKKGGNSIAAARLHVRGRQQQHAGRTDTLELPCAVPPAVPLSRSTVAAPTTVHVPAKVPAAVACAGVASANDDTTSADKRPLVHAASLPVVCATKPANSRSCDEKLGEKASLALTVACHQSPTPAPAVAARWHTPASHVSVAEAALAAEGAKPPPRVVASRVVRPPPRVASLAVTYASIKARKDAKQESRNAAASLADTTDVHNAIDDSLRMQSFASLMTVKNVAARLLKPVQEKREAEEREKAELEGDCGPVVQRIRRLLNAGKVQEEKEEMARKEKAEKVARAHTARKNDVLVKEATRETSEEEEDDNGSISVLVVGAVGSLALQWTHEQVASALIKALTIEGKLKPNFARERTRRIASALQMAGLDGSALAYISPKQVELRFRKAMKNEVWVSDVVAALKKLAESTANAKAEEVETKAAEEKASREREIIAKQAAVVQVVNWTKAEAACIKVAAIKPVAADATSAVAEEVAAKAKQEKDNKQKQRRPISKTKEKTSWQQQEDRRGRTVDA